MKGKTIKSLLIATTMTAVTLTGCSYEDTESKIKSELMAYVETEPATEVPSNSGSDTNTTSNQIVVQPSEEANESEVPDVIQQLIDSKPTAEDIAKANEKLNEIKESILNYNYTSDDADYSFENLYDEFGDIDVNTLDVGNAFSDWKIGTEYKLDLMAIYKLSTEYGYDTNKLCPITDVIVSNIYEYNTEAVEYGDSTIVLLNPYDDENGTIYVVIVD
jgi:hypothetical protein